MREVPDNMAETTQITFTHRELVTALLRQQNIHDGIWGLSINFNFGATNIGPTPEDLRPAAVVSITSVGLQKFEKETSISVDASKVNPRPGDVSRKERQRSRG
jgi:hypothetical protein